MAKFEIGELYVVCGGITISMDEVAGATEVGVSFSLTAGFLTRLMDIV